MYKKTDRLLALTAGLVSTVLATACSGAEAPDLESLGLAIEVDIAAGTTFEVAVPEQTDTTVRVRTTPAGVTAAVTDGPSEGTIQLTVNVEFDTPRGDYNLGLGVFRGGEEFVVEWPFTVVEPDGPRTATTLPADASGILSVDVPSPLTRG